MSATSDTVGHFFALQLPDLYFQVGIGGEIYGEKAGSKARSCLVECVFLVPSKSQRFVDVHSNVTTRCEG